MKMDRDQITLCNYLLYFKTQIRIIFKHFLVEFKTSLDSIKNSRFVLDIGIAEIFADSIFRTSLVYHHIGKFLGRIAVPDKAPIIIAFYGIGHGQNSSFSCFHPDGLIITGPVHEISVACFL